MKGGQRDTVCTGTHAFIPAADCARMRMVYSSNGSEVMNVLHFRQVGAYDASALVALNEAAKTAWETHIKPRQTGTCQLLYLESTAIDVDGGAQDTLDVNEAGTATGEAAPNNVTQAIKFTTGFTGRSSRGRLYFIGLNKAAVSGDQVTDATIAANISAYEDFFADIQAAVDSNHVIVSYCNDGAWRTSAAVLNVTGYLSSDKNVDSQRRRLAGRGI